MMQLSYRLLTATLAAACGFAPVAPAGAAYYPRADSNAAQSIARGLGVRAVPVLRRETSRSALRAYALLATSLPALRNGAQEKRSDRLRVYGGAWQLDVFGDGSGAEYVNRLASSRAHAMRVRPANAPSSAALEAAGRTFIARSLASVIVLAPGERLVPEASSARTETEVRVDGKLRSDAVVASRIVFTREINGIPVVGAGSKVTVTFLNDGTVESFRYDWPAYVDTRRSASLAAPSDVLARVQRVMMVRGSSAPAPPVRMPMSASAVRPLVIGRNTQLERFACGYYDPGFMNRDARAPVQAGCYYHVVQYQGQGSFVTAAAYSGAVPAAKSDEPDLYWPEAMLLHNMRLRSRPAAPSAQPGTTIQPVPKKHR